MRALLADFPKSEYVKDAQLQIASTLESQGQHEQAAQAYVDFATRFAGDAQAGSATLKAADLFAAAGLTQRADDLRLGYVHQHPEDIETAMDVLEGLARRDLDGVDAQHPVSKLLAKADKKAKAAPPPSHLAEYLAIADAHPKLASRDLVARVHFLEGEEAGRAYAAAALRQPLAPAIAAKQKLLNTTVARYRQCVDLGVPEWSHASTYRIGEALMAFGEALEKSERPADLHGEDLQGYEEVLLRQSQAFGDKGETVWIDLLKQQKHTDSTDVWTQKAQAGLWHRLADRFAYMPEADFPLVSAEAAHRVKPADEPVQTSKRSGGKSGKTRAREEGTQR